MAKLPLRRNEGLMTVLVIAAPMLACAMLPVLFRTEAPDLRTQADVYTLRAGAWQALPPLPGGAWGLGITADGRVWSLSAKYGGVCRLDGDRWRHFGKDEFGGGSQWIRGGLAVRGNEVWAATSSGPAVYDGKQWRSFSRPAGIDAPVDIAADESGVWLAGDNGAIGHYDGSSWTAANLNAPKVAAEEGETPRIAAAGGGRLWAVWRGLWLREGGEWRAVRIAGVNPDEVWLVGHEGENVWLWLWARNEIASVTPQGTIVARHTLAQMGMRRVEQVVAANGRLLAVGGGGLAEFDGSRWTNRGRPPGTSTLRAAAVAPDGALWVVGQRRQLVAIAAFIGPPLAACIAALIATGLLIVAWLRGKAENQLAGVRVLAEAAGTLPGLDFEADEAEIARQSGLMQWRLCGFLVAVPFLMVAAERVEAWGAERWPAASGSVLWWLVVGGFIAAGVGLWVLVGRLAGAGARPSRFRRAIWAPARFVMLVALVGILGGVAPLGWVDHLIRITAIASLAKFALIVVAATAVVSGREIAAGFILRDAARAGDYDRAIRWIRRIGLGHPNSRLVEMEGVAQALAGRKPEAEQCLREALALIGGEPKDRRSSILGCLGEVLTDQGRYEEAGKCLQGAIDLGGDKIGSSRMDLAELLLHQGNDPARALALIDEAIRLMPRKYVARFSPSRQAKRAWALATLGRTEEAAGAIRRGLEVRKEFSVAFFAAARLNIARAYAAMGKLTEAREQFRAAAEADPSGKSGQQAQVELARLAEAAG